MLRRLLILLCLVPVLSYGDIYQYKDKDGHLSFTDKPKQGAKQIQINDPSSYESDRSISVPNMTVKPNIVKVKASEYKQVAITSPLPDETITNGIGLLDVSVVIDPPLRPGDTLVLYVDGQRAGDSPNASQFTLHNLDRGTHVLQVKVETKEGLVVGSSTRVSVHIHRPHIGRLRTGITPRQLLDASKGGFSSGEISVHLKPTS